MTVPQRLTVADRARDGAARSGEWRRVGNYPAAGETRAWRWAGGWSAAGIAALVASGTQGHRRSRGPRSPPSPRAAATGARLPRPATERRALARKLDRSREAPRWPA